MLLYLFGSKSELVQALLARARQDELAVLSQVQTVSHNNDLSTVAAELWKWLAADEHRALLTLWVEGYARSLIAPESAWAGFARNTVHDWLHVLADTQPPGERDTPAAEAERTLVLGVLRGAMLDLLATGDITRTTNAIDQQLTFLHPR